MKVCLSNPWLKVLCIKTEIIQRINKAKSSAFNKQAAGRGGVTFTLLLTHSRMHAHTHKHACTHSLTHSSFSLSSCNGQVVARFWEKLRDTHSLTHTRMHAHTHTHKHACTHSFFLLSLSSCNGQVVACFWEKLRDTQAQERAVQTTQILDSSGCCKTI